MGESGTLCPMDSLDRPIVSFGMLVTRFTSRLPPRIHTFTDSPIPFTHSRILFTHSLLHPLPHFAMNQLMGTACPASTQMYSQARLPPKATSEASANPPAEAPRAAAPATRTIGATPPQPMAPIQNKRRQAP
jgi:hypothetical protein